jgi:N-acetyl-anhydromuramyl-L-alanine amidase AmpD
MATYSPLTKVRKLDWISSGHFTKNRNRPVDRIVLHHNAGTNFNVVPDVWRNREASAHYQVGTNCDGIVNTLGEEDTAWHCGNWEMNCRSIGIENVNSSGEPNWQVHPETVANCARLVADICRRYNIPCDRDHVLVHRDVSRTKCPGGLNVDEVIRIAQKIRY